MTEPNSQDDTPTAQAGPPIPVRQLIVTEWSDGALSFRLVDPTTGQSSDLDNDTDEAERARLLAGNVVMSLTGRTVDPATPYENLNAYLPMLFSISNSGLVFHMQAGTDRRRAANGLDALAEHITDVLQGVVEAIDGEARADALVVTGRQPNKTH